MKAIGFNFTKISIEKISDNFEKINLDSNIEITEIKEIKSDVLSSKEELLNVKFSYTLKYSPDIAVIETEGYILVAFEPKQGGDALKDWNDSKKLSDDFRFFVYNIIIKKATLKALELEEELNIPLHVPMPSLKPQEKQEQKK